MKPLRILPTSVLVIAASAAGCSDRPAVQQPPRVASRAPASAVARRVTAKPVKPPWRAATWGLGGPCFTGRWKPRAVGFHAHLRADGVVLVAGRPMPLKSVRAAVRACFNLVDSAGIHILITAASPQRGLHRHRLSALLQQLRVPGVTVYRKKPRP